jgi:hypothetical protein
MQSCKVLDTKSEDFNLEGVTYMAKTGICSIVVIATNKNVFSQSLKPRIQPFQTIISSKMKGVRTCFTDAVRMEKFISWLQENTSLL